MFIDRLLALIRPRGMLLLTKIALLIGPLASQHGAKNYPRTVNFEEITREPLKAPTSFGSSRSARAPPMRAALSSSSGHIISSDDTGANSFQHEIVDRAERCGSPFLFDRVKKLAS